MILNALQRWNIQETLVYISVFILYVQINGYTYTKTQVLGETELCEYNFT